MEDMTTGKLLPIIHVITADDTGMLTSHQLLLCCIREPLIHIGCQFAVLVEDDETSLEINI